MTGAKILSLFAAAFLASGPATAHIGVSDCQSGKQCLARAADCFDAGDIGGTMTYLHGAMELNCLLYQGDGGTIYILPEVHDDLSKADCYSTIAAYCMALRQRHGDWRALSCLYGRYGGKTWDKIMRPLAENILAENGLSFRQYLRYDRIDWYNEVNIPMLSEMYGIELKK